MQIYIHRNNQQLGPFTETEVKAQLASGAISLQDHVWWEGQQGWVPLSQSFLATQAGVPPVPTTAAPAVPAPAGGKTSGLAIASMVCGIVGLFCGLLSIAAIVLGHLSRAEIKKNPSLQGSGFALTGLILGYVWLPIYICIFVFYFLVALGQQVKTVQNEMQPQSVQSTTNSDQTTNAADQSIPVTTNSPDQSTNSTPATTNSPDQSTNSTPATTNSPDQSTNSAPAATNSPTPSTNAPDNSTNTAPMTQ
jgi:hypothetical protein